MQCINKKSCINKGYELNFYTEVDEKNIFSTKNYFSISIHIVQFQPRNRPSIAPINSFSALIRNHALIRVINDRILGRNRTI